MIVGIMKVYHKGICENVNKRKPIELCVDFCNTVNSNIELFLKGKNNKMVFGLENAKRDFRHFLLQIEAEGDREAALAEWNVKYNADVITD